MIRIRVALLVLAAVFCGTGCGPRPIIDRDWPDAYWRSGEYVLIAIDSEALMSLSIDDKNKWGITSGIVGPTVFSVGANDRYIVAKQHPLRAGVSEFDPAVTNYFIVNRMVAATLPDRRKGVIGPLTKEEFDRKAREMHLPAFTKTFSKLEWQRTE